MRWKSIDHGIDHGILNGTVKKDDLSRWISENGFTHCAKTAYMDIARILKVGHDSRGNMNGYGLDLADPLSERINDHGMFYKSQGEKIRIVALLQPYKGKDTESILDSWCIRNGITWMKLPESWYYPMCTEAYLLEADHE